MKKSIERFYPLIVFLFALLLYANTIPNDYNLDDELVTINHRTTSKGFAGIKEIFTSYYYEDEMGYKYDYRPITHLSFAIEHQFFGESPQISHAVNVILYAILSLLIFFLVNRLAPDKSPLLGFIVALIFVAHPIHTEVVASIKNRDEILSLLFGLASFYTVINSSKSTSFAQSLLYVLWATTLFYLSVYAKMSTAALAFFIPIYLLVNRVAKPVHLVFSILSTGVFSYILFGWGLRMILVLTVVHISYLIFYLLFDASYRKKILNFFQSRCITNRWIYLSLAYLFVLLAYLLGGSLMFILGLFLMVCFLFLSYYQKEQVLLSFVIAYPILLIVTYNYNYYNLALPYFVVFALLSRDLKPKDLTRYLVVFLLMSTLSIYCEAYGLGIVIGCLFLLNFRKVSKYIILILALGVLIAHIGSVYEFVLSLFFLFGVFVILWPEVIRLKRYEHFKFIGLFLILALLPFYFQAQLADYERLPENKLPLIASFEEQNPSQDLGIDRPVLFVENPIINNWDWEHRFVLGINTNIFYFSKLCYPYPLLFYYGYDQVEMHELKDWQTIVSIVLLLLIVVFCIFLFFKGHYLAFFALLWLEVSIIPYANLLTTVAGIVGERLAFTTSFGFSLLLGMGLYFLYEQQRVKRSIIGLSLIVLIGSSSFVVYRNTLWKNKLSLFEHDIKSLENSAQAHALLASATMASLDNSSSEVQANLAINNAILYYEKAINIYPDFFNWYFDLGRVYFLSNNYPKAKIALKSALEIDSAYTQSYKYLLDIANDEGNLQEVIAYSNLILRDEPNNIEVLLNLSAGLYFSEQYAKVLEVNDKIIGLDKTIPEAFLNKAYTCLKMGDKENAQIYLNKGKLLNPSHGDVKNLENIMSAKE